MTHALTTAVVLWVCVQLTAVCIRYGLKQESWEVGLCSVTIKTASMNRQIYNLGRRFQSSLRQLYGWGLLAASMLAISSVLLLLRELVQIYRWTNQVPDQGIQGPEGLSLTVAVPGVTVPWSHAAFLWAAIAISVAVHEAGHALAATSEGVGVHFVACFAFMLLPGAMVGLDTETLAILSPGRTLKIVCAGVWHNVLLCALCYVTALFLPLLFLPLQSHKDGATIRRVISGGALDGHLVPGDMITSINSCGIRSSAEWVACLAQFPGLAAATGSGAGISLSAAQLMQLMIQPNSSIGGGFCVPHEMGMSGVSCQNTSECGQNEVCFRRSQAQNSGSVDEFQGLRRLDEKGSGAWSTRANRLLYSKAGPGRLLAEAALGVCLNARQVVQFEPCSQDAAPDHMPVPLCPTLSDCLLPLLGSKEELLRVCFVKASADAQSRSNVHERVLLGDSQLKSAMSRASRLTGATQKGFNSALNCPEYLAYVGSKAALLQAIETTDYRPIFSWLPVGLPNGIKRFLEYTFAVSAALALLNMAPIYGLDGAAALQSLLDLCSSQTSPSLGRSRDQTSSYRLLYRATIFTGTVIFVVLMFTNSLKVFGYDAAFLRLLAALRHIFTFTVHL